MTISNNERSYREQKLQLSKKEEDMPTIFFYGPKLEKEKRKEMIKSFTETASRLTGIEKSAFAVFLRESSPEDVGVGGELLEDVLKARQSKG